MIEKSMESEELNKNEMNQKKKIKLIIISKNGKLDKQKEKSKITLQNEKGKLEIRMENMTQTLNKKKINKALKSFIKNISDSSFDKNKEKTYTSADNKRKSKKKFLISDNDNNDYYYDIYLQKKKKSERKNSNQKKKEQMNEENILFKKIKIIEKEKETNLINSNNNKSNKDKEEEENNVIINDDTKESNRNLIRKNNLEDGSMNNKFNTNREIESSRGVKNDLISNNLNINNFFRDDNDNNNKKEKVMNLIKNKETEENKNVNIYYSNHNRNNNNSNNNNNISRNIGRELMGRQNSAMLNQSTNNYNKVEQITSESKYKMNFSNNINLNIQKKTKVQKNICSICEITYISFAFYVAECNRHFLCKKCAKSFFEEKIETGAKELFCPFLLCGRKFSNNQAKKFLSKKHYEILIEEEKNNNLNSLKLIKNNNYKEMKNYSENHVLDINNNKKFYNFNKNKNIFCSKCNNETLFCREKQLFMRCLYCGFAQCKHCFKEYTHDHLDMNSKNYCRIYYRDSELDERSTSKIIKFLIQLFLVFAIFFLSIISLWKVPKDFFTNCFFKLNENNNNCFLFCVKIIFIYFFTFVIFMICLPINILMFPWFPSFLALFDY